MKSIITFHNLFLILFLLPVAASGQNVSINISGFIKDAVTGEALIGANILIYKDSINANSPPFSGAASNGYGFYVIPKVPAGNYILIARYVGYKAAIREIKVLTKIETITYNIDLTPEELRLDEILIESKRDNKNLISAIDVPTDLIQKLPSLSGETDIFRALQLLPGVKTGSEISNGLYIRGGSPDQTLTLVDGVIVYNPSHLGNIASTFNSNALQNIRLIKGAFPAEYGGRLSSILDIKLRSGTKEKEKGIIGLGLINSYASFEGPINEKATYMISGRKMYYDVFQKSFDKASSTPRYNFFDINSKVNYNLSNNNIISVSALFSKDKIYSPENSAELDYDIEWKNSNISLNWLQINSRSLFLNSTFSYVNYFFKSIVDQNTNSISSSNYYSSSSLTDLGFKQRVELKWHEDHVFKTGIEISLHNYELLYSDFYDQLLENDPFAGSDIQSIEGSIYFQNESQLTSRLTTNAGVRIYYFSGQKLLSFEPRFSTSFAFTDNLFLKAAFAIAHQFLHLVNKNDVSLPTDLWYPSSEGIEPGKSIQYVLGLDSYFSKQKYLLSIETYYKEMDHLYEFKNAAKLDPFNKTIEDQLTEGKGESYGIEFFFNKKEGDLTGWLGYTLAWTRRQFDELNGGKVFAPRYDRLHDVSFVLTYDLFKNLSAGMTWTYATGQRFSMPPGQYFFTDVGISNNGSIRFNSANLNEAKFPAYHKLDLNLNYKFYFINLNFEAYLNLYNVYNRQNPFAQYLSVQNNGDKKIVKLKRLILFPFIPTLGFNVKF